MKLKSQNISIKIEVADATHNGTRFPNWQQTSGQMYENCDLDQLKVQISGLNFIGMKK
jgi:hypothetical protein